MRRATVDLPQPDSPTSDSVSPRLMVKETPSTARRTWRGVCSITRFSHGRETSKSLERLVTSRRGLEPRIASGMHSPVAPAGLGAGRGHFRGVEPACGERLVGAHEVRALDLAAVEDARAAGIERAARRDRVQARHRALDLGEAPELASQ